MALFAAGIVAADQVTKYLTVTNIAISPLCIPDILENIGSNAINKLYDAYGVTQEQIANMPTSKPAIDGVFQFSHHLNDGAAWSSFQGMQWLFALIFLAFTVAIVWEYKKKSMGFTTFEWWCIAAIYGGGLGNMIDRVRFGYVIDMIETKFMEFPVFNVADCFITCGCIALIIHLVFFNKKFWKEEKKK